MEDVEFVKKISDFVEWYQTNNPTQIEEPSAGISIQRQQSIVERDNVLNLVSHMFH
jgi:hypothetical protein